MAVSGAQHKPMIAEADRAGITVGRRMPHTEDRHRVASSVFAARLARQAVCRMVIGRSVLFQNSTNRGGPDKGPGCLNRFSASISGASAGVMLPSGWAAV